MRRQTQFLSVVLVAVAARASAQEPTLAPATAIDVQVQSVQWHPLGEALLYSRPAETGAGSALGLFMPGQKEGKVVLELGKDDAWEVQWFDTLPGAIVNVYRTTESSCETTVYVLDAKTQTAKSVFGWRGGKGEKLDVDVDVSPTLYHAVFRMRQGEKRYHYVLPVNGTRLLPSPDLDLAVKKGLSGPSWSIDGTAVYGQVGNNAANEAKQVAMSFEWSAQLQRSKRDVPMLSGVPFVATLYRQPLPPVGSDVMELVPSNAVLRPVRFRGAWEYPATAAKTMETRAQPVQVQYGTSRANVNSLWLVPGGQPSGVQGAFVAAGAGESWVAPLNRGIAYLIDGALFVRLTQK